MLIETIKVAHMRARKAHDSITAILIATIIGEAEMVGKTDGNRASTDEDVFKVLKKFEKNQLDNIVIYRKASQTARLIEAEVELGIIRQFLPARLTDLQVEKDIGTVMSESNLPREQKSMGAITKELRTKYGDQFDGGQVSMIFKQMLT
jgi:uncharacterized protein YqeY